MFFNFSVNNIRVQRGIAAMTTMMFVLGVFVVLIASYGLLTANAVRQISNVISSARAYYVAEAGVEDGAIRYIRSGGTLTGSNFKIENLLVSGNTTYDIETIIGSTIKSTSDAGDRYRKIVISLNSEQIYTYAALVGKGGLYMSDTTFIHCVAGADCKGDGEAGDAGAVYVDGNIWANGGTSNSVYGLVGFDSRITGHVFAWGDVDIRPSERKEPDPAASTQFICLGAGSSIAECSGKNSTAIVQKVFVHEGGYLSKRAALRIAYMGNPHDTNFPTVKFYSVRKVQGSSNWEFAERILLEKEDATTIGKRVFSKFPIDRSHDGTPEPLNEGQSEWVYFNLPNGMLSVGDGESVFLVLQVELPTTIPATNGNYWKIFYDDSVDPDYVHSGGYGGYIYNTGSIGTGVVCPASGSSKVCDSSVNGNELLDDAPALDGAAKKADFHFRFYSLSDPLTNYTNSLHVTGELHADEALGASVVGSGTSANHRNIAFVGRRFASTFSRDRSANQKLWGYSFVQQLDNCDITGASGTETAGNDLETRRGFRVFCDSDVRNVSTQSYVSSRKYISGSNYPVQQSFYCNPYKNGGTVDYGGTQATCSGTDGQSSTPYQFNVLASADARGCFIACGSNGEACSGSNTYNTYYISPPYSDASYGDYPYNFCKYATGVGDIPSVDTESFITNVLKGSDPEFNIPEEDINKYLPRALDENDFPGFPISDNRIDSWVKRYWGSEVLYGTDMTGCLGSGGTYSVETVIELSSPTCINGNLVVRRGGSITLRNDAHLYVAGNLQLLADAGYAEGVIKMKDSGQGSWDSNSAGLVIVKGIVDTETRTQFKGGAKSLGEFMFVISRSDKKGEEDPLGQDGLVVSGHEDDQAAMYLYPREDGGSTASYYAPHGSVVLKRVPGSASASALQVAAYKLIMERGTEVTYDYGIKDINFPDGPAQKIEIGDYDEVAP